MKRSELKHLFPRFDPDGISFLPMLDQFHDGVMITDELGVIRYMNDAQATIDDLDVDYAIGKKVTDLYRVDEGVSPVMTCIKTGKAVEKLACFYRTRLGKIVNSLHNIYPLYADNVLAGTISYITEYKNMEQAVADMGAPSRIQEINTFGVSPSINRTRPKGNGTRCTFEDIIGNDATFLTALASAKMASASPSPIMIYGETGTGKELFAQSIHNHSPRRSSRYVAVNCAAIPENLLEGMLFGTSKGAFTGAIDKAGLIETANGGTLFLDEINSMSPGLQAKLLRIIQERKVRRVGSLNEADVDLKIISSINVTPEQAVESGMLRQDLFYRLAVVLLNLPPLRERPGDLFKLTHHFLIKCNKRLHKQITGISMDVIEKFGGYGWPGNVRELEHIIEGAMNMIQDGQTIEIHHLAIHLREGLGARKRAEKLPASAGHFSSPGSTSRITSQAPQGSEHIPVKENTTGKTLAEMNKESEVSSIKRALEISRGNAARAARSLGISPQLMNYKLKRYNIDRKGFMD